MRPSLVSDVTIGESEGHAATAHPGEDRAHRGRPHRRPRQAYLFGGPGRRHCRDLGGRPSPAGPVPDRRPTRK
ncbi:hypothetical protein SGPA1_30343 [Streptomyces misionensis JCM 4497]